LETFSALVDPIPFIDVGYSSSGIKISEVQSLVVKATVTPQVPNEEEKKRMKKLKNTLLRW